MSEDRLQRSLNDYLDDRMDADERERFEERLATDEELGRRLATSREIRTALRSGDEELSPGFYTRTVARFTAARRRAPFGVAWSTVGLAAATIAAAAIFIPAVLREEIPEMPLAPRVREEAARLPVDSMTDDGDRPAEEVESSLQSLGYAADDRTLAEQDKGDIPVNKSIAVRQPKFRDARIGGLAKEDPKRQAPTEAPALLDDVEGHATPERVERIDASERADRTREFGARTESVFYNLEHGSIPVPVELKVDLFSVRVGELDRDAIVRGMIMKIYGILNRTIVDRHQSISRSDVAEQRRIRINVQNLHIPSQEQAGDGNRTHDVKLGKLAFYR